MIRQVYECLVCGSRFFKDRLSKEVTMVTEIHTCRYIKNLDGSIYGRSELIGEKEIETLDSESR
jgi:hypothetical protein